MGGWEKKEKVAVMVKMKDDYKMSQLVGLEENDH